MVELTAKNIKTGEVLEFTTDWMFDDRYGYFVLEDKNDWEIEVKNSSINDVVEFENIVNGICKHPKKHKHTCPYRQDVLDDAESLCRCCDKCTTDCEDDI